MAFVKMKTFENRDIYIDPESVSVVAENTRGGSSVLVNNDATFQLKHTPAKVVAVLTKG
ncbi:MAG: hypothetical protein AAGK01_06915 [Pseudomonadota bacterium]